MIQGIGKVLCFHAKTGAMAGDLSALVASGAIQEVSAVKLDPRFCRKHFEEAFARGLEN